jgi:L-2-hydroxyglutarate oxidase LhgO
MTDDDIIKQRVAAHHCFYGMEYSEDRNKIADWAPLIMDGGTTKNRSRQLASSLAATSTTAH